MDRSFANRFELAVGDPLVISDFEFTISGITHGASAYFSAFGFVEGQRRLGERWRLELELRLLDRAEGEALAGFRKDSFMTFRLARFFLDRPRPGSAFDSGVRL